MLLPILLQTALSFTSADAHTAPSAPPLRTQDEERDETPAQRAKRLAEERRAAAKDAHDEALREHQWLDADGNPIRPGVLPAKTTEAAAEAWRGITTATGFEGTIESFDLSFNLILRQDELDNQMDAHLRFLRPAYLSAELGSGRSHLRGPEGDFLIDGREVIPLMGREGEEDRKQIDRTTALARNFLGLVDPTELRILDLIELESPPAGLPVELTLRDYYGHEEPNAQALGAGLRWLSLRSPDFELESGGGPTKPGKDTVRSCLIGYHPETFDVELAIIQRDTNGKPRRVLDRKSRGNLLVVLGHHRTREDEGIRVPHWIGIFDITDPREGTFRKRPGSELILEGGSFRPGLAAEDFLPPKR